MSARAQRGLLLGGSFIALCLGDQANAQTELAPITVTAPRPIPPVAPTRPPPLTPSPPPPAPPRPAPVTPSRTPAAPAEQAATPPTAEASQPGVLPIVTDQFATVTVVPNAELRRTSSSTLGDLLLSKPGITGSSFAPGASSRPIIRGLDVNRVGILENGTGGGGVSGLGEDHFVPINPPVANQNHVIPGPGTFRYGPPP